MHNLITNYINNLTKDDLNNFAIKKNIFLSNNELNWTYSFIKNNYLNIINNPNAFNIELYRNNYSEENYNKIKKVFNEYFSKYSHYL